MSIPVRTTHDEPDKPLPLIILKEDKLKGTNISILVDYLNDHRGFTYFGQDKNALISVNIIEDLEGNTPLRFSEEDHKKMETFSKTYLSDNDYHLTFPILEYVEVDGHIVVRPVKTIKNEYSVETALLLILLKMLAGGQGIGKSNYPLYEVGKIYLTFLEPKVQCLMVELTDTEAKAELWDMSYLLQKYQSAEAVVEVVTQRNV